MYECLLDSCPHPKSKYHFQALRTLVLAHHMQVAALQSVHLELYSILLSHLQDLKDVTSHTHYENYRTGKLTAMMKSGEVANYNL